MRAPSRCASPKRRVHLGSDLVTANPGAGPDDRDDPARTREVAQRANALLEHARGEAAPARMQHRHRALAAERHRQAVGGDHDRPHAGQRGRLAVCLDQHVARRPGRRRARVAPRPRAPAGPRTTAPAPGPRAAPRDGPAGASATVVTRAMRHRHVAARACGEQRLSAARQLAAHRAAERRHVGVPLAVPVGVRPHHGPSIAALSSASRPSASSPSSLRRRACIEPAADLRAGRDARGEQVVAADPKAHVAQL